METRCISVVVPVYNVEKYLERCIESIIKQTYQNLDIILVDDGSTDSSGKICDFYATKDSRINVIHQMNGGLSDARNKGISVSRGELIAFIDSDDYVAIDYIEYLHELLVQYNADISICAYKESNSINYDFNEIKKNVIDVFNTEQAFKNYCYQKGITQSAWGRLFKKSLFNNIFFPVGKLYEDEGFFYKILSSSRTVVKGNQIKYLYFIRNEGIIRSDFTPRKMDYIFHSEELVSCVRKNYPILYSGAISKLLSSARHIWVQIPRKKSFSNEYNYIYHLIKTYRLQVIKDVEVRKVNKIVLMMSYLGHSFLRIIYRIKLYFVNKLS